MKKRIENAVLTILSTQEADKEKDSSELNTTASFSCKNGKVEISYQEIAEGGEVNGETVISVLSDNLVTIHKTGFTEAVMVLETGRTHTVRYQTMLGTMEMMLCATNITTDFNETGGSLMLRYMLDIGETYSAVNTIQLRVKVKGES